MITRRLFNRALPLVPLAARKANDLLRAGGTPSAPQMAAPAPSYGYVGQASANAAPSPVTQVMPRHQAARLALQVPAIRDAVTEAAWQMNRFVHAVEPDIEVYRSFSPMAKITFQRQRNVERLIAQETMPSWHEAFDPLHRFIDKLMWLRK